MKKTSGQEEGRIPKIIIPGNLTCRLAPSNTSYCAIPPKYPAGTNPDFPLLPTLSYVTPGSIPAAVLYQRVIQKAYAELENILEILPRHSNAERKRTLLHYFSMMKTLFSSLVAIRTWASSNANDICYAQNAIIWHYEQEQLRQQRIIPLLFTHIPKYIAGAVTRADVFTACSMVLRQDPSVCFPKFMAKTVGSEETHLGPYKTFMLQQKIFHALADIKRFLLTRLDPRMAIHSDIKVRSFHPEGIVILDFPSHTKLWMTLTKRQQYWRILRIELMHPSLRAFVPSQELIQTMVIDLNHSILWNPSEVGRMPKLLELSCVLYRWYITLRLCILYEEAIHLSRKLAGSFIIKKVHRPSYNGKENSISNYDPYSFEITMCDSLYILIKYPISTINMDIALDPLIQNADVSFSQILDLLLNGLSKDKLEQKRDYLFSGVDWEKLQHGSFGSFGSTWDSMHQSPILVLTHRDVSFAWIMYNTAYPAWIIYESRVNLSLFPPLQEDSPDFPTILDIYRECKRIMWHRSLCFVDSPFSIEQDIMKAIQIHYHPVPCAILCIEFSHNAMDVQFKMTQKHHTFSIANAKLVHALSIDSPSDSFLGDVQEEFIRTWIQQEMKVYFIGGDAVHVDIIWNRNTEGHGILKPELKFRWRCESRNPAAFIDFVHSNIISMYKKPDSIIGIACAEEEIIFCTLMNKDAFQQVYILCSRLALMHNLMQQTASLCMMRHVNPIKIEIRITDWEHVEVCLGEDAIMWELRVHPSFFLPDGIKEITWMPISIQSHLPGPMRLLLSQTLMQSNWNLLAYLDTWQGIGCFIRAWNQSPGAISIRACNNGAVLLGSCLKVEPAIMNSYLVSSYRDSKNQSKNNDVTMMTNLAKRLQGILSANIFMSNSDNSGFWLHFASNVSDMMYQLAAELASYVSHAQYWSQLHKQLEEFSQCSWINIEHKSALSVVLIESHIWKHQIWWNIIDSRWTSQVTSSDVKSQTPIFTFEDSMFLCQFIQKYTAVPSDNLHIEQILKIVSLWGLPAIVMKDCIKILQASERLPAKNMASFQLISPMNSGYFPLDIYVKEATICIHLSFCISEHTQPKGQVQTQSQLSLRYKWTDRSLRCTYGQDTSMEARINQSLQAACSKPEISSKLPCHLYYAVLYLSKALFVDQSQKQPLV